MTEGTYSKLADLAARLRSLESVARNRGSLACDRLANQIGDIRGELERVATDMGNPISPTAESQSVCTCPSGDGSLRWPCPAHPPVGDAVLRTAVEYHYAQAAFPCGQFANTSHHPNPKLQAWHKQVADALSAQQAAACPKCGGTGEADSGGVMPWGAPAMISCDCQHPSAVDNEYPSPRNRHEAEALARMALAHLGLIGAHIDAIIARCETDSEK